MTDYAESQEFWTWKIALTFTLAFNNSVLLMLILAMALSAIATDVLQIHFTEYHARGNIRSGCVVLTYYAP
ncbi:MAG: hypothetical protein ABSE39_12905 [Candidatus Bathyarchaeia archaeon]